MASAGPLATFSTLIPNDPDRVDMASDDENIDQLDDTEDEQDQTDLANASASPKGKSPTKIIVQRPPGQSLLPVDRLETILQADGCTGSIQMTKEGLFLLSLATEEFVKRMARSGQRRAESDRRNIVTYPDMSSAVRQNREIAFLRDIIPSTIPLSEAIKLREKKQAEFLDEDGPSFVPPIIPPPPSLSQSRASTSYIPEPPSSNRTPNGKEKSNGKRKQHTTQDKQGMWTNDPNPDIIGRSGDKAWVDWSNSSKGTSNRPPTNHDPNETNSKHPPSLNANGHHPFIPDSYPISSSVSTHGNKNPYPVEGSVVGWPAPQPQPQTASAEAIGFVPTTALENNAHRVQDDKA